MKSWREQRELDLLLDIPIIGQRRMAIEHEPAGGPDVDEIGRDAQPVRIVDPPMGEKYAIGKTTTLMTQQHEADVQQRRRNRAPRRGPAISDVSAAMRAPGFHSKCQAIRGRFAAPGWRSPPALGRPACRNLKTLRAWRPDLPRLFRRRHRRAATATAPRAAHQRHVQQRPKRGADQPAPIPDIGDHAIGAEQRQPDRDEAEPASAISASGSSRCRNTTSRSATSCRDRRATMCCRFTR